MSSSTKRFFFQFNDANLSSHEIDESDLSKPAFKRQKLSQNGKSFPNPKDYKQFESICEAIEGSEWMQSLNIRHVIVQIAEYATGKIKDCTNPECNEKIVVLEKDLFDYNDSDEYYAHYLAKEVGFKWWWVEDEFYCFHCIDLAAVDAECQCDEFDKLYLPSDCKKCDVCRRIMGDCYNHCSYSKCAKCEKESDICNRCVDNGSFEPFRHCVGSSCKESLCLECANGASWVCRECWNINDVESQTQNQIFRS